MTTISVFGLGYVGAVSVACLAESRHRVIGVDVNPLKADMIRRGDSPIIEKGLGELLAAGVESGRVEATTDAAEELAGRILRWAEAADPILARGGGGS